MVTATSIDLGAENLAHWVIAVGQRLRRLPRCTPPVMLAHAMTGFLAIGRASMALLTTSANPMDIRAHDAVFEITADAESRLTAAATEPVVNQISDRGEELLRYLSPGVLDASAKTRLRGAARITALCTRDLLATIDNDTTVSPQLRELARDLAARADVIVTIYDDNPHRRAASLPGHSESTLH